MNNATMIEQKLQALANPDLAQHCLRYFKTAAGQYGEGDQFLGITVPQLRRLVKPFRDATLSSLAELLHSPWHESRLMSLFLLIDLYQRSDEKMQTAIYQLYLAHTRHINNWDLVDTSAPHIVGHYLFDKPRHILDELAQSKLLWERRIAILATFYFIRQNQFTDTLRLTERLLHDPHDLMHKANGWMLREIYKRNAALCETFLQQHLPRLPRTTLRYAIEKMPAAQRKLFLQRC